MTVPTPHLLTDDGKGYVARGGIFVNALPLTMLAAQALPLGQTLGPVFELGKHRTLSLVAQTTAKSGTNPTLDLAVQTSPDGATDWQSAGSFGQQTDVGLAMSAVASTGTTPPTLGLTGTAVAPVDLVVQATDISGGATRGLWLGRYSTDHGITWTSFTSAATIALNDAYGVATGLTLTIAAGSAATDNVWTAKTSGYERKRFSGLGRFARVVAQVGGTSTPIMTSSVTGEAI